MSNDQITARIDSFVKELEVLVRSAAVDAVSRALGGNGAAPVRRAPPASAPRPAAAAKTPPPTAKAGAPAKLTFKRKKGTKRTAEQLAQIDAAIVAFVKSNAGKGVEHMGKALGVPTNDLKLRVGNLVAARKLKKTGVKRATKYFVV